MSEHVTFMRRGASDAAARADSSGFPLDLLSQSAGRLRVLALLYAFVFWRTPQGRFMIPARLGLAIGCSLAAMACHPAATPRQRAPETCTAVVGDSVAPTREAFFREVLFPAPTARTARFDDYTPGSYHVDKLDLAEGLPAEAQRCGVTLRALLVVGPVGPLWAYHVIGFVNDGDSLRISTMVMPHARITGKGTGRVSEATLQTLLRDLQGSPLVRAGSPTWPDSVARGLSREFTYQVLLTVYRADTVAQWYVTMLEGRVQDDQAAVERLFAQVNRVLDTTKSTYPDSATAARRSQPN